jgi:hypothetical protein
MLAALQKSCGTIWSAASIAALVFFFVAPGYLACRSAGVRYDKSCRSPKRKRILLALAARALNVNGFLWQKQLQRRRPYFKMPEVVELLPSLIGASAERRAMSGCLAK